jgi:hypothetical protein
MPFGNSLAACGNSAIDASDLIPEMRHHYSKNVGEIA